MTFTSIYTTPAAFDNLLLTSDGEVLTGVHFVKSGNAEKSSDTLPVFKDVSHWLDIYFSGREPDFTPDFRIDNATPFRKDVLEFLQEIPFGKTVTYGDIAAQIAKKHGIEKMSAQAVGGAVGWNPIGIIIPCHRVVGVGNKLVGYGGGIENKMALLKLEGHQ
ncbi:MAG: methylated-DNA--[protein]-cysteine S-methyltransferase [Salinivirgaceae bacterium]|nr:methylated-DNA--[protein]-cysteine S-methyltransferase [Salinivirgaceae bacterium]